MTKEKEQLECEFCSNILREKGSFGSLDHDINGVYNTIKIYQCPICKEIMIREYEYGCE